MVDQLCLRAPSVNAPEGCTAGLTGPKTQLFYREGVFLEEPVLGQARVYFQGYIERFAEVNLFL